MTDESLNISLIDTLLEKWRRRKFLILACFLLVFSAVTSFVLALPSLYKSTTTILFGQKGISESLVRESVPNELELRLGLVTQAVLSRTQLQEVIDAFDLYPLIRMQASPESVINRLRQDIDIDQQAAAQPQWGQSSTYSISISYQGWDPDLAAAVANDLAERFKIENELLRTGKAARTTEFIKNQLEEARARFAAEETRIEQYKNDHMGELPEQQAINLATLERLNSELRLKGEKEIQLLGQRNELLFGSNGSNQTSGAVGLTGGLRLDRLERDLTELQLRYTANYPEVIRLEREIADLKRDLDSAVPGVKSDLALQQIRNPAEIDLELAKLGKEEAAIRLAILDLVSRIEETPQVGQQLTRLAYDYDTAREEYLSLQKLYQDARLAESMDLQQNQQFRILELAIPPDSPAAPNQQRLLFMAFVMAIGMASGAGLFAEQLDRSFHNSADIRRFTNIPVLAVIANIRTTSDKWRLALKYILVAVLLAAGILLLVSWSGYAGSNAEQLVWMLAD